MSIQQATKLLGEEVVNKAVFKELKNMMRFKTFSGVIPNQNVNKGNIVPSKLFLKLKTTGELKARLVAGGHRQAETIYERQSSPTVSFTTVLIVGMEASRQEWTTASIDVPSAYLQAKRDEKLAPVFMILAPTVSQVLISHYPDMKVFVRNDGSMLVQIDGGIYGLIESSNIWNKEVKSHLINVHKLKQSKIDPCLFIGDELLVALYVDDLLVVGTKEKVDLFYSGLCTRYGKCKINQGTQVPFLRMMFDWITPGSLKVSMDMPKVVLEINKAVESPAGLNLFAENNDSPRLDENDSQWFYSTVAKLLYICSRCRPDAMLPVNYLCSRVGVSTKSDMVKLHRVLKYLNGAQKYALNVSMQVDDGCVVVATYIDASYATHIDMKSHSGVVISVGAGAVLAKSSKQRCVSKSSTEAELIAVSDYIAEGFVVSALVKEGSNGSHQTCFVSRQFVHDGNYSKWESCRSIQACKGTRQLVEREG